MNVDSMKWGEFKICDLFEVYTGALVNQSEFSNGKIPRITATDLNNGIAFFTQNVENKNFRTLENFISISFLGSVFYQKNKVSLDMKIHAIKPKNKELNVYIALFLIPLIKNFTFKYMYGYQLSTHILKIQKLMLPIDSKGNPNYAFMESCMRKLEQKHLTKIIKYYKNKLLDSNGGGGIIFATHLILLNLHFAIPILYPAILIFYRVIPIFCLVILSKAKYPKDITNNPTLLQQSKTLQLSLRVA